MPMLSSTTYTSQDVVNELTTNKDDFVKQDNEK